MISIEVPFPHFNVGKKMLRVPAAGRSLFSAFEFVDGDDEIKELCSSSCDKLAGTGLDVLEPSCRDGDAGVDVDSSFLIC